MKEEELGIIIATITATQHVPGTQRLHQITMDVGNGQTVQIASGIAGDFPSGYMVGKQVPILISVNPVKIRGILSEARFLATSDAAEKPVLLVPESPVPAGTKVW
jgi:methionyl-tRNA synthetase